MESGLMSKMNWSVPRGSRCYAESCARIRYAAGNPSKRTKPSKWTRGALYTSCSHYVAEAWVLVANNHKIAAKCPACKRQSNYRTECECDYITYKQPVGNSVSRENVG